MTRVSVRVLEVRRRSRGLPPLAVPFLALVFPFLVAAPALGQDRGEISGMVTEARSGQPVSAATVHLVGTDQGTITNAEGRYRLPNVLPGEYQLRVQLLGYRTLTQPITVTVGGTVAEDFSLEAEALRLDDIVVTGTAGQARQREVGNAITQVNVSEIPDVVPNVDQLLQARAPGINVSQATGSIGSAAQIRLRGFVSVTQSNQPIVYVDGVRVQSEPYTMNNPPVGFVGRSSNTTPGPLSDINPADIERLEIIKGSAATSLYGSEAAAGVIQIFTKRGRPGAPVWTAQVNQGANRLRPFAPEANPYLNMDPFLRTGHIQKYSLSVSGGTEQVQYFVSGSLDDEEGVLPLDQQDRIVTRGNFTFSPLDRLTLTWNTQYTRNSIQNTPSGNNAHGLTLNAYRAERNYFGLGDPDSIAQVLDYEIDTWIDRFVTGGTMDLQLTDAFSNRLTVGYDVASQENRNLRPFGFRMDPRGIIADSRYHNTILSVDYVGNYRYQWRPDFVTTLSLGGQSITTEQRSTEAYGENFPVDDPTVSAAAEKLGFEERLRLTNAGFFGQALLAFRDRYFLTVGTRVDGHTAFGEDLGLQVYPKVSGSYVISDEDFWNPSWGSWKLRAALGQAGRSPEAFDAVRTWDPVGYGGEPAFFPQNLGNPDLGPERTTEIEVGFDGAFLDNRISTDFTYYHQKTTDALFDVRYPPSEGFALSQLENVGTIQNSGLELSVMATLFDRPSWGLNAGVNVSTNSSEVLDLGDAAPFDADGGWVEEGHPVLAARGARLQNPGAIADPEWDINQIYGPRQPTHIIGGSLALRLPRGMEISARGEYQGGHYIFDGASNQAYQRDIRWPTCFDVYDRIDAEEIGDLTAWQRGNCIQANYETGSAWYPADFFKLRDVTFRAPVGFALPAASSATLSVSVRNWFRWRNEDFLMFDPEMVGRGSDDEQAAAISEHIPPAAQLIASLRVVF